MLTSIQRFDHSRRDGHELPSVSHHGYETGETMDFDQQVSKQVSKLLQSCGSDAMICLYASFADNVTQLLVRKIFANLFLPRRLGANHKKFRVFPDRLKFSGLESRCFVQLDITI